jgi:hypothetical protein
MSMSEDGFEHLFCRCAHKNAEDNDSNDDNNDDDADYDSDEEEDYETEDKGEGEVKQRRLHRQAAYKPEEGTEIGNELKQFHQKIHGDKSEVQKLLLNNVQNDVMRGKQWFGPNSNPLSTGKGTSPDAWYLTQLWKFAWMPFDQYWHHVNLKDMHFIHCNGEIQSH